MSEVSVQGTEHWTRKGDVRLFLWRKTPSRRVMQRGRFCSFTVRRWRRSRRSTCRCPAGPIHRRWIGLRRAASTPGVWTMRATDARTSAARSTATSRTAPTTSQRVPNTSCRRRRVKAPGLRYLFGRAESCPLRRETSGAGRASRPRRLRVDRQG